MSIVDVIRVRGAVQYTGSNGLEVAVAAAVSIVSDSGSVLELGDSGTGAIAFTLNAGDWFELSEATVWPNALFEARHVRKDATLLDIVGIIDAISVEVPVLSTGASVIREVGWSKVFPSDAYALTFIPDASTRDRLAVAVVPGSKTASFLAVEITARRATDAPGVLIVLGAA